MEYLTESQIMERAEESLEMSPVNYAAALDMIAVYKAYINILKRNLDIWKRRGLLDMLQMMPEYKVLEKELNEKLTLNNAYVEHFAPEAHQVEEVKEEHERRYFHYLMTENEREEEGVENLVNDRDGWFSDFVHDEIMSEVTEFIRGLICKMRGISQKQELTEELCFEIQKQGLTEDEIFEKYGIDRVEWQSFNKKLQEM